MPRPRPLSPGEAGRTLAHRFSRVGDRLRQLNTKFGIRPYRVELVWTRWSGAERGEGREEPLARVELLPTPRVRNLDTSIQYRIMGGGFLPSGTLLVQEISALYTQDQLSGLAIPDGCVQDPPTLRSAHQLPPKPSETSLPEPFDFYWEVREDGRGDDPAERARFRLAAWPWRNAGNVQWEVMLERVSGDPRRDGSSTSGFDPE